MPERGSKTKKKKTKKTKKKKKHTPKEKRKPKDPTRCKGFRRKKKRGSGQKFFKYLSMQGVWEKKRRRLKGETLLLKQKA